MLNYSSWITVMNTQIWITQVFLALISAVCSTELLPERYLKPQNFNHHPFTDVGIPASLKKASKLISPYAILATKRPREGREFPPQNVIFYPTPHPSVMSRKQIETNEISRHDDPYAKVPKNYAFSYVVKDRHSGDDFSHSQAHNGKATRGQYRVKLPDGRTQIVSYTADHKGYRADVQYEEDLILQPVYKSVQNIPETPTTFPQILPNTYRKYYTQFAPKHISPIKPSVKVDNNVPSGHNSHSSNYVTSTVTAAPVSIVTESTPINLLAKQGVTPTVAPHYYHVHISPKYVSTTSPSYLHGQYISPTTPSEYLLQHYISSTPHYPVKYAPTTPAPAAYGQGYYQSFHQISSTISQQHAQIFPTSVNSPYVGENKQQQPPALHYGLLYRKK